MTTRELIAEAQKRGGRLIILEFPGAIPEQAIHEAAESDIQPTIAELAEAQGEALKLQPWAKITGLSRRELDRAVEFGALPHHLKERGRDAGAVMVHPGDMAEYLRICDAVRAGRTEAPGWWSLVRLGKAAEVDRAA